MTIFALIPAAGKSRRMGTAKLALPFAGRIILEQVIATLRQAGVQHILVVLGPHHPELVPLAAAAGAHVLLLAAETVDMRATVEHGLQWLEDQFQPAAQDSWLLVPADHPALEAAVVQQLLQAHAAQPDSSIVVPTFHGRRGHPPLMSWKHVARIRSFAPGHGLDAYLRQQGAETLELPVQSEAILYDLDTPEDYEELRRQQSLEHDRS